MLAIAGACAIAAPSGALGEAASNAMTAAPATPIGSPHDFDFEHGRWRTTLRRRLHPLSGSDVWADYAGTTVVHPLLGGRANVVELDVSGREGHIQALSLRLYDPKDQRWTLNFSNAASGTLAVPMTGGFGGAARGVFYSLEDFGGRRVLVRFVIESTNRDTCRFEQAFSADGGATWETNWIAVDTRL
ncbi:MAG TPA: DUF1579 domain-containing protein [Albitalea sp.]|nr:DUF1579 domain-containing protein [Albitalea sp.]